jgi:hypothetical protein
VKYIGNIGNLLNSIYVRDKLPKSRRKRTFGKKTSKNSHKNREKNALPIADNSVNVNSKLFEIRTNLNNEIKNKGKQTEIKEGFVYIVVNPVFSGWIKAGKTTDFEKRLSSYNVGDPFTNYQMKYVKWVKNRTEAEETLLRVLKFKSEDTKGEWFKINESVAKEIIDSLVF